MKAGIYILLIIITGIGCLSRVYNIAEKSLWSDELVSIAYATGHANIYDYVGPSIPRFTEPVHLTYYARLFEIEHINYLSDISTLIPMEHPPLYFLILHVWLYLFGVSESSARLLSAVFGTVSIPIMFVLVQRIRDDTTALIASAIFALAPYQISFAQEVHGYALVILIALLSTVLAERLARPVYGRIETRSYIGYVISSILGFYTHYFYAFLFVAHMVFFCSVVRDKAVIRRLVVCGLVITTVCAASYSRLITLSEFLAVYGVYVEKKISASPALYSVVSGYLGFIIDPFFSITPLAVALIIFFLMNAILAYRKMSNEYRYGLLLGAWLAAPVIGLLIADSMMNTHSVVVARYFILGSLPLYILVAIGMREMMDGSFKRGLVYLLFCYLAVTSYFVVTDRSRPKERWRDAAEYLNQSAQQDDLILANLPGAALGLSYYLRRPIDIAGVVHSIRWGRLDVPDRISSLVQGRNRIWVVFSHTNDERGRSAVSGWFEEHFTAGESRQFKGIEIYSYVRS